MNMICGKQTIRQDKSFFFHPNKLQMQIFQDLGLFLRDNDEIGSQLKIDKYNLFLLIGSHKGKEN